MRRSSKRPIAAGEEAQQREPKLWLRLAAAYLWTPAAEERLAWFFKVAKFTGSSEPTARLLLDFLLDIDRASALSVAMENPDLRALLDDPYFRRQLSGRLR